MRRVTIFLALILVLFAAGTLPTIRAGAQQAVVTDDNLDQMIASAKTPAEHEAIASFYEQQATDAKKKAALHRNTAETYRKLKISKPVGMAEMCDGIAAMWPKLRLTTQDLRRRIGRWPRRRARKLVSAGRDRRAAAYSMSADRGELSATATEAVESRSSKSGQVRSWVLAAISELIAALRSPFTSDALACPSRALNRCGANRI
jgi:hypothetical protein